jgi:hypothetical protein
MRSTSDTGKPPARTLLEVKIRERNMTLEEFAEYAEVFARENDESGTLSVRHLQRLLAPTSGSRPRELRPATRRLLESIFDIPISELLRPLHLLDGCEQDTECNDWPRGAAELARLIDASHRVDEETVRLLANQVETTRRLDRRFGAATLLGTLRLHAQHIETLMDHCTGEQIQRSLAAVLTDAHTLSGWQSLDRGEIGAAWNHYRRACDAARAAESPALHAHALAEQAVVLSDIGRTTDAVQMSAQARALGGQGAPLLRSWLAAAHGEALAADAQQDTSLRAFDDAQHHMPARPERTENGPYLALDGVHLARWRGHALARFGHPDAITVLSGALTRHDAEFSRAEAGLRTDLVFAHLAAGEHDAARQQLAIATQIADAVGSTRQRRRLGIAALGVA